jgi:hypothetical protein
MTDFATGGFVAMSLLVVACGSKPSTTTQTSYALALEDAGAAGDDAGTGFCDPSATFCMPADNVSYSCAYKYKCVGGVEKIAQKTVTITPPREKCDPNALNPVRQDVQDACGGEAKVASFKCDCAELDVEDGDHCDTTSVKIP